MILKQNPKNRGRTDISDLNYDPVVIWQHKRYGTFILVFGILFPTLIAGLGWGDWKGGLVYAGILRFLFVQQATFCVNSLAHWLGEQVCVLIVCRLFFPLFLTYPSPSMIGTLLVTTFSLRSSLSARATIISTMRYTSLWFLRLAFTTTKLMAYSSPVTTGTQSNGGSMIPLNGRSGYGNN
jgi:hypothetical protein